MDGVAILEHPDLPAFSFQADLMIAQWGEVLVETVSSAISG